MPGWRTILRGRGKTEVELKPGDGESEAAGDVRRIFSNCGPVWAVYCPGSNCAEVPWAESVSPTNATSGPL